MARGISTGQLFHRYFYTPQEFLYCELVNPNFKSPSLDPDSDAGGVRVAAFIAGGILPDGVRGTKKYGLMHICDWYATFAEVAGYAVDDPKAAAAGLPAIDSVNQWHFLLGGNFVTTSNRTALCLSSMVDADNGMHAQCVRHCLHNVRVVACIMFESCACGKVFSTVSTPKIFQCLSQGELRYYR